MRYRVEYTKTAIKQLKKIDKKNTAFILTYIKKNLVDSENPRLYGKSLQGNQNDKWRYRIGNYRVLAQIEDEVVVINIVEVGTKEIFSIESKLSSMEMNPNCPI